MKVERFLWVILLSLLGGLLYLIVTDKPISIDKKCGWNGNIYNYCDGVDFISEID